MDTKICSSCKEQIVSDAKKCKFCGSDVRGWAKRHPFLTLFLIFFGLPVVIVIARSDSSTAPITNQNAVVVQKFDASGLLGKNIDQIRKEWGEPTRRENERLAAETERIERESTGKVLTTRIDTWQKEGISIQVEYMGVDPVDYIFIENNSVGYSSEQLMRVAGLEAENKRYKVTPQNKLNGDEQGITGLHVCLLSSTNFWCKKW